MAQPLVDEIDTLIRQGLTASPHPLFPGAVFGIDDGHQVQLLARGQAYVYADATGTLLPERAQRPMTEDTRFDLASVTKLFTATVVVQLVERGVLGLDDPVGRYFTSYAFGQRAEVTVRHLLTHTSGLPSEIHFWQDPDPSSRRAAVLTQPLEAAPGTRSCYSCVGYITLGMLVEQLLGQPLDLAVQEGICDPLGLSSTGYRPLRRPSGERTTDTDVRDGIAATEMRRITWSPEHDPDDPDPRGVVHDENAASLGGVSGNAGLFADARDLLAFGRAFLGALENAEPKTLGISAELAREMVSPQLPSGMVADYQSGLGWRIDDPSFMTGLLGKGRAYGHPGFTGTSLVVDESRNLVCVLLTNRVHPSRDWSALVPFRQRLAARVAAHCPR